MKVWSIQCLCNMHVSGSLYIRSCIWVFSITLLSFSTHCVIAHSSSWTNHAMFQYSTLIIIILQKLLTKVHISTSFLVIVTKFFSVSSICFAMPVCCRRSSTLLHMRLHLYSCCCCCCCFICSLQAAALPLHNQRHSCSASVYTTAGILPQFIFRLCLYSCNLLQFMHILLL